MALLPAQRLVPGGGVGAAPGGGLAPGGLVEHAGTLHDVALADGRFLRAFFLGERETHGLSDADGHAAFLGVAQDDFLVGWRFERDLEVEDALAAGAGENPEGAFVAQNGFAVGADPFVLRADDAGVRAGFYFEKLLVEYFSRLVRLRPEIDAVDRAVGIPEGAVVFMILFLRLRLLL